MSIASLTSSFGRVLKDNSPAILAGVAVSGVVATTVLAVRVTPRAVDAIYEERMNKIKNGYVNTEGGSPDYITKLEILKVTWKFYIPAAAVGAATITAIILSNRVSARRAALMAAGYSLLNENFVEYREKIVETLGKAKEQKARDEIQQDHVSNNPPPADLIPRESDEVLFRNDADGRYFYSTVQKVRKAQNDVNEQCINGEAVSQNEFCQMLGLEPTRFGEEFGWNSDTLLDLNFTTTLSDKDQPCISLEYRSLPIRGYYLVGERRF